MNQEFDHMGDRDLARCIYETICALAVVEEQLLLWDASKLGRAIAELDKRFNRS